MTSAAEARRPGQPQDGQPAGQRPQDPQRRDPRRRQRILSAAAELVAERGYHEVGMADIGAAAGVTGSAIYRHFDGKSAVLVAMFDHVMNSRERTLHNYGDQHALPALAPARKRGSSRTSAGAEA